MKKRSYPLQPSSDFERRRWIVAVRLCGLSVDQTAYVCGCSPSKVRRTLGRYGRAHKDGRYEIAPAIRQLLKLPEYVPLVGAAKLEGGNLWAAVTADMPEGYYAALNWEPFHVFDDDPR